MKVLSVEHIDTSKQQMWERKLLDLSLRNNLLNVRVSKNTIQLISASLGKLEDRLAAGDEFQILPKPLDWDNPLRNSGVYQSINLSDPIIDLVKQELSQKRLRSYLTDTELSNSLISLYRSSRLSLEENGANTLYIALGLLKWYETSSSERPCFAPILLLPVEIIRRTAQKSYIIRSREEDAIMNITLLEMIRQDFGINIGGLEILPKDESGVDVKLIFNIIRQAIMSKSKWDVEEQAFLGTFSFNKFIMWNDIHSNADKLSRNKVVASLIAGKMKWDIPETTNSDHGFDKTYHPSDIALPISADSSQLSAICAAAENNSFVLHGPPGTGKSQTIENTGKAKEWRAVIGKELSEGSQVFLSLYGKYFTGFNSISGKIIEREKKLQEQLGIDFARLKPISANRIENCEISARKWLGNIENLRDWVNWLQAKDKAIDEGLTPLIIAYEGGLLKSTEVAAGFQKGLYRACAEYIFSKELSLSSFNGQLFEEKIKKFRKISKDFEQLTKQELFTKLAAKIPSATQEASQSSEIGILQRAIRNGGRGLSIRKLFDSISNLLPRMCPCMLMSPISVAQYFDANTTKFDLVIFDEASQMPTCEAVGAIARGTNVIVVGDPKQMPPTNFFSSNHIDEDNENEDLESILDDCLALSMPSKYLLWHYRSKHESLIAFSNSKYYDNKLLTFPSPDDLTSKVSYVPIEGFYDRSKTRQNQAEAKAIIDEIIRRLSDPALSKRSIGVVTFSSVQQLLIDDMLHDAFKINPAMETIAMESPEPIFIKNLENVQGDERDVILFSVGYGPDKEGKVNLNFGPLNRSGGWRRLNVAVSRARYEMKVFSTLRADQIDITRTSSDGVAGLKDFLEYAEKGKAILGYRNPGVILKTAEFVKLISEQIKEHGYEVNTNIGCSGYRIDIGIIDVKRPSRYVLGILCDGYNYSAGKTARDREIVQYDVLKSLGWHICRVWSTDWWENPDAVIKGIIAAINETEQTIAEKEDGISSPSVLASAVHAIKEDFVLNNSLPVVTVVEKQAPNISSAIEYEICRLDIVLSSSSEDFLMYNNQQKICSQIIQVIKTEAPISKNLLCKRVLSAWGITRLGTRINTQFESLFMQLKLKKTGKDKNTFFWNEDQSPQQYDDYRLHKKESEKRDPEDLPPEEVANAVREILTNQISFPKDELIRETARVFGFSRTGNNVETSISNGVSSAIYKGFATLENDRIVLKE